MQNARSSHCAAGTAPTQNTPQYTARIRHPGCASKKPRKSYCSSAVSGMRTRKPHLYSSCEYLPWCSDCAAGTAPPQNTPPPTALSHNCPAHPELPRRCRPHCINTDYFNCASETAPGTHRRIYTPVPTAQSERRPQRSSFPCAPQSTPPPAPACVARPGNNRFIHSPPALPPLYAPCLNRFIYRPPALPPLYAPCLNCAVWPAFFRTH